MAAPVSPVGTIPTLASPAEDATYKTTLSTIEHAESNLFGNAYGTTGEIAGTLGEQLAGTRAGLTEQLGPGYAKGELFGGSIGRGLNERTRALSGRAGANIQSGIYGNERANAILGFTQRAAGVERRGTERIKDIENKAREKWEADQFGRAKAVAGAEERYRNNVARNPARATVTAAGGGPPGSAVNTGPGSPGQPIKVGSNEAEAGGPFGIGGLAFGPTSARVGGPPRRPGGPPRRARR